MSTIEKGLGQNTFHFQILEDQKFVCVCVYLSVCNEIRVCIAWYIFEARFTDHTKYIFILIYYIFSESYDQWSLTMTFLIYFFFSQFFFLSFFTIFNDQVLIRFDLQICETKGYLPSGEGLDYTSQDPI